MIDCDRMADGLGVFLLNSFNVQKNSFKTIFPSPRVKRIKAVKTPLGGREWGDRIAMQWVTELCLADFTTSTGCRGMMS
jgi:hypothetical protein